MQINLSYFSITRFCQFHHHDAMILSGFNIQFKSMMSKWSYIRSTIINKREVYLKTKVHKIDISLMISNILTRT